MHQLLQLTNTSNLLIWQFGLGERNSEAENTVVQNCGEYCREIKLHFKIQGSRKKQAPYTTT